MPVTPVDEHSHDLEQLAGLSALDVLEGDELARFEQHAGHCPRCRLMVRLDREALARVALTAPEMEPSADFKARVLRRGAEELGQSSTATPQSAPRSPSRRL